MSNNDLLDSYFEGAMTDVEKQDFLSKVEGDPQLKKDFQFQQEVIEGLKNARIAELKARLDTVPVGGGLSTGILSKVAVVGGIALLAGLAYYYNQPNGDIAEIAPKEVNDDINELITENKVVDSELTVEVNEDKTDIVETPPPASKQMKLEVKDNSNTDVEINKPQLVEQLDLLNGNDDEFEAPESGLNQKAGSTNANIEVNIDNSRKKYSFHYQLKDGKLFLYGTFNKGLYEILEFNTSQGKTLYLYYKDKYYGLSKNQSSITPLVEVKEAELINKLEQVRIDIKE